MIIDQSSIVGQKFIPISWMISDLAVVLPSHCCGPRPAVGLGQARGCGWGRDQWGLVEQGTI